MVGFPFSSLRSRLFGLVLLAIIPAIILILLTAAGQRRLAEKSVEENTLRLARLASTGGERVLDETRSLLTSLAYLPPSTWNDPNQCSRLLSGLATQYSQVRWLAIADLEGGVHCASTTGNAPSTVRTLFAYQKAAQEVGVVVTEESSLLVNDPAGLVLARSVRDGDGQLVAILLAAMDVSWLEELLPAAQLPESSDLIVVNSHGQVLLHVQPQGNASPPRQQDLPIQSILAVGEGTVELETGEGNPWLYGFTPIDGLPPSSYFIGVGVSEAAAFAEADALLLRQMIALAVVFVLAFGAAWLAGDFFILRRVNSLLYATRRLQGGDWSARTGLPYGLGELSQLARAFDHMAATLESREQERLLVSQKVERHNRDLAALTEAFTAISGSLETPDILSNLKRQLATQWQIPGGVIYFYNQEEDTLYLESAWGVPSAILASCKRIPAATHHYEAVIRTGEAYLSPDFRCIEPYAQTHLAESRPEWQDYLCVPLLAKGEAQGIVELFSFSERRFSSDQVALFITLGQQTGLVIQNARLFDQVRGGRQRLQMLSQQLLEVQEQERRHISRELHDEIGQSLTALKVNLQAVIRLSNGAPNLRYLEESIGITEQVLHQVRDLSLNLRPSLLDDLGVIAALRWYLDRQAQRAGFKTEFIAAPPDLRLPGEIETVLFRVVQEALTNVVRHAVASHVQVLLAQTPTHLELFIRDNGIGFNVLATRSRITGGASLGLVGMQERVQLVGGELNIYSNPLEGTEIQARIPLHFVDSHPPNW